MNVAGQMSSSLARPSIGAPAWLYWRAWKPWLLALILADLSLLPMFHAGGIPIKIGFLLVMPLGIAALRYRTPLRLALLFGALTAVVWIGTAWLWVLAGPGDVSVTLRMTAIYVLAACGFGAGYMARARTFNIIVPLLVVYCGVTLALTFFWQQLPGLIAFYGLQPLVEENLFAARSPGIMYNPNLSGLALNMLIIALVFGRRYGLVTVRLRTLLLTFMLAGVTQILLASRGEMLTTLALGVALALDLRLTPRHVPRAIVMAGLLGCGALIAVHVIAGPLTRFPVVSMTLERVVSPFTDSAQRSFLGERATFYTAVVRDRFATSPIWGTGFDGRDTYPYSQVGFHNDWYSIGTAGGAVGILLMLALLRWVGKVSWVAVAPFFASGFTNAFVAAPLQYCVYWVVIGLLLRARREQRA